jgi:transposase-like protein
VQQYQLLQQICYSVHMTDPGLHLDSLVEQLASGILDRLDAVASEPHAHRTPMPHLSVGQVAERLGVARSTVYAHWREWGGYKLGDGAKAPIRFDATALPGAQRDREEREPSAKPVAPPTKPRRRRRRALLTDTPRFIEPVERTA